MDKLGDIWDQIKKYIPDFNIGSLFDGLLSFIPAPLRGLLSFIPGFGEKVNEIKQTAENTVLEKVAPNLVKAKTLMLDRVNDNAFYTPLLQAYGLSADSPMLPK